MMNHLAGLSVHILDDTHMVVQYGSVAMWIGTPGWAYETIDFAADYTIDMNAVGLNGRDGGMFDDGSWTVYAIYNPTSGDRGFIVSKQIRWPDVDKAAIPGFIGWRKLMYGHAVLGGKLVPVHATHWPQPVVHFTEGDTPLTWTISVVGQWVPINLQPYIPENSRLGIFAARISNAAGSIWLSPTGNVPNQFWKAIMENQVGIGGDMACRVGNQAPVGSPYQPTVFVWAQGSGIKQVILRGYCMTENT